MLVMKTRWRGNYDDVEILLDDIVVILSRNRRTILIGKFLQEIIAFSADRNYLDLVSFRDCW